MNSESTNQGQRQRPEIPDHELIKVIGHGSYGEVWLARTATGSYRAVKVVYRHTFDADKPYEREFTGIKEFEPISRSHPAQIDVLHVGRNEEAGYFYYVLELADDESAVESPAGPASANAQAADDAAAERKPPSTTSSSISRVIHPETYNPRTLHSVLRKRGRLPVAECLRIALGLAEALEHLHSNGLVHRDIKPSNVIFVNGRPKLADIGLVARSDSTLSFVGTEGYLPPEGPGKPQSDIYSLGKVLYEISSGKDRSQFPQLPDGIEEARDHKAFLEFNEIVLKACENLAVRRYQNAAELAKDLRMLMAGRSLRWRNLLSQTARRSLKVAALLSIATLFVFLVIKAFRPEPGELDFSSAATLSSDPLIAEMGVHHAWRRFDFSPTGSRIVYTDSNGRLFLYEHNAARPLLQTLARDWLFDRVAWSHDGTSVAVSACRRELLRAQEERDHLEHSIFICDTTSWEATTLPATFTGRIRVVLWKPDGTGLTVQAKNGEEWANFDVTLDGELQSWPNSEAIGLLTHASSYSPDGRWICGSDNKDIWLIKAGGTGTAWLTFDPEPEMHPAWRDNQTLYYVRYDSPKLTQRSRWMRLTIDTETGKRTSQEEVTRFLPWSQLLYPKAVDSGQRLVFIEQATTNQIEVCSYPKAEDTRHVSVGDSPRLSPDGSELYYIDRVPRAEGIYRKSLEAEASPIRIVGAASIRTDGYSLSPDTSHLVYARPNSSYQPVIEVVTTDGSGSEPLWTRSVEDSFEPAFYPQWSPQGNLIALCSGPRRVDLIDADSGKTIHELELNAEAAPYLGTPVWSPSGDHLALILLDHTKSGEMTEKEVHCVDVYSLSDATWNRVAEADYIEMLSWRPGSNEGELTYFGYADTDFHQSVSLRSGTTKRLLPKRPNEGHDFWGVWSPQGDRFYFISQSHDDGEMYVYDVKSGLVEQTAVPRYLPYWSRDGSRMVWVNGEMHFKWKAIDLR